MAFKLKNIKIKNTHANFDLGIISQNNGVFKVRLKLETGMRGQMYFSLNSPITYLRTN